MKRSLLLICLICGTALLQAQSVLPCATSERLSHQLEEHPDVLNRMQQIEAFTADWIANHGEDYAFRAAEPLVTIPVVFHVVYNIPAENVSDAQLLSQIDVLNEDFRKLNADTINTLAAFQPLAADIEIEFCLATLDPLGNPTTGIERTATAKTSFSPLTDDVKSSASGGADAWPPNQYLNFWVCDIGGFLGGDVIGYATFPGGPPALDGVVVDYLAVGRQIGTATAPYDLGRAATHEVGHWLNLRHTWGDCLFGIGCCTTDDGVSDTPNTSGPGYGCPLTSSSCSSLDMVQNYMDYSDDDCSSLFTLGQKSRMLALFAPGGARESLITSPACGGSTGSCDVPANPVVSIAGPTTATVGWDPVAGASSYTVQGRAGLSGAPASFTVATNSLTYSAFVSGLSYDWRVRANCGFLGASAYSSVQSFTMPTPRIALQEGVHFYPNPASDLLVAEGFSEPGELRLSVFDITGRLVHALALESAGAWRVELDVSQWASGLYIVRTEDANGNLSTDRLVIE